MVAIKLINFSYEAEADLKNLSNFNVTFHLMNRFLKSQFHKLGELNHGRSFMLILQFSHLNVIAKPHH